MCGPCSARPCRGGGGPGRRSNVRVRRAPCALTALGGSWRGRRRCGLPPGRSGGRRRPGQPVWTVVLTDGRANVGLGTADPWRDALSRATALAACGGDWLVVDTETGWPRFGRAAELARALGAPCLAVEDVLGRPLA